MCILWHSWAFFSYGPLGGILGNIGKHSRLSEFFPLQNKNFPTNFEIECKRDVEIHVISILEYQFGLEYVKDSDFGRQMGMITEA